MTEHMEWFVDVNVPADLTDELSIIEYIQKEEDWVYDAWNMSRQMISGRR